MNLKKILLLIFILGWGASLAHAERVKYVIDGDTCILMNEQRVRLLGVDTPEIKNVEYQRLGEFFGEQAKSYLKQLIEGKEVRLVDGPEPFDKYGRRLAYIYLDDLLVNRELVRLGYAEAIRRFPYDKKDEFLALEAIARHEKLGMWQKQSETNEARPLPWGAFLLVIFAAPFVWKYIKRGKWH